MIVKENQEFLLNELTSVKTEPETEFYEDYRVEDSRCPSPVSVKEENVSLESKKERTRKNISVVKKGSVFIDEESIQKYKTGGKLNVQILSELNLKSLFICDYCDKYFTTQTQITSHVIKCNASRRKKNSKPERPSYRRVPKPHELIISCPLCPPNALKFKNHEILQLHLTEHDRFERIDQNRTERNLSSLMQCPNCERRFGIDEEFEAHLKNHQVGRFMTCELCGRSIVSSSLKTHLKLHFKRFCCEFCSHKFRNRCDLMKHIRLNHERPDNYECNFCRKKIKHKAALEKHLEFCRGPGTVGPCIHCGQKFLSRSDRMYHVQKFHLGYVCRMCNVQLEGVTALKNHRKSEEHKKKSYEARLRREQLKQEKLMTKKAPLRKVTFGINMI